MTDQIKDQLWNMADTMRGAGFALQEMALHKMSHGEERAAKMQANRLLEAADKLKDITDQPSAADHYRAALVRIMGCVGAVMYEDAMASTMREIARIALGREDQR